MLRLGAIDPVDAEPSAAWRGNQVHAILEDWFREDGADPETLRARAEGLLGDVRTHPMIRALWGPRLIEAVDWIAREVSGWTGDRHILAVEGKGTLQLAGVELSGRFDRIDRTGDGGLVVVDYKTGQPPSTAAVRAGFSLQLGLLGMIADEGKFAGVTGETRGFEYWSLARNRSGGFGYVDSPCDPRKKDPIPADEFVAAARANFVDAVATWLTGGEPFTAKLKPEYAPFGDYDQLMRRDEWYGRERR